MSSGWGPPPRRRPPWWPEDRPWPPPQGWRRGPPGFVWRLGCLAVLLLFAFSSLVSFAVFGAIEHRGPGPFPLVPIVIVGVIVLAVVGAGGMSRFARPMDELIDAAGRVQRGDYSASVSENGPRQLRSVARAFNAMSARLKASDERRRSFLADVVHELRTPLAVIQAQAEAIAGVYPADEEHLAPIVDATHALERLVEDLRALALTDTGSLALHREPVDAAELVRDTAAAFEAQAEAGGVGLTTELADGLPPVDVDPVRIRSALGNVVANAIRYTPRGGTVTISAARAQDGIAMTVVDTGSGIPPELQPRVFERFARGPESKGSGLGLAIAHDIVIAHGGHIEVVSSSSSGTTVRITVPLTA
jgi:two-component system sensor histidine kinase BaeS